MSMMMISWMAKLRRAILKVTPFMWMTQVTTLKRWMSLLFVL